MTLEELKTVEYSNYCRLIRIKKANKDVENTVLEDEIKESKAKLELLGVSLEQLQ